MPEVQNAGFAFRFWVSSLAFVAYFSGPAVHVFRFLLRLRIFSMFGAFSSLIWRVFSLMWLVLRPDLAIVRPDGAFVWSVVTPGL